MSLPETDKHPATCFIPLQKELNFFNGEPVFLFSDEHRNDTKVSNRTDDINGENEKDTFVKRKTIDMCERVRFPKDLFDTVTCKMETTHRYGVVNTTILLL